MPRIDAQKMFRDISTNWNLLNRVLNKTMTWHYLAFVLFWIEKHYNTKMQHLLDITMVTVFFFPHYWGSMNSRDESDTQTSFFKDKPILQDVTLAFRPWPVPVRPHTYLMSTSRPLKWWMLPRLSPVFHSRVLLWPPRNGGGMGTRLGRVWGKT